MTNKTLWTKGPWQVGPYGDVQVSADGGRVGVAACGGAYDSRRDRQEEYSEQCANARLIASAPEMDELLGEAIDLLEGNLAGADWKRAWRDFVYRANVVRSKAREKQ